MAAERSARPCTCPLLLSGSVYRQHLAVDCPIHGLVPRRRLIPRRRRQRIRTHGTALPAERRWWEWLGRRWWEIEVDIDV